jgi:hypothetical protein
MRKALLFALVILCQTILAININKNTISALENINKGYVQYGCELLKKTAAVNDIAAQYYMAVCYEQGIGTEKDMTQAFKMYRKAAERGLPDAMYHIASFYRDGVVVSQDTSKEKEWLQRYNQKGGKMLLPDIMPIYNEGLKHPENYALTPNGEAISSLIAQGNGNGNSQKQTINNITIVQQGPVLDNNTRPEDNPVRQIKSDVDKDIPETGQEHKNTFALIIANEHYQDVAQVPNALHDGQIFAEYCEKTLGIPEDNIKYIEDATLNVIRRQLNWLTQVMEAHEGDAHVIVYYAGHGIPDESSKSAYLLPVDGYGTDVSTGYSLDKLCTELGSKPAKSVIVLLDACFSGANRDGKMLASARGVAIKAKQESPQGNIVVFSAAQGDQTAYPYKEKGHGLFTYYILKKLKETRGKISLGELTEYVTTEVKKRSIIVNSKLQTPTASSSAKNWKNWKMR